MPVWRFVDLRGSDPYRFQCLREVLDISVGEGLSPNTLLFSQLEEHVSMGRRASIKQRVHPDFCKQNNIPVSRSFSPNSSSAFIDSNSIRCLVAINRDTDTQPLYEAAVASLRNLGLEAMRPPKTNNIVVKERKISICNVNSKKSVLAVWTIVLDFNHDRAEKAILSPKDMREWVTTAKEELGRAVSVDELKDSVKRGFQHTLGITFEEGDLSARELNNIEELLPKYTSETWLKYGKWSPVKDYWRPE